MTEDGMNYSAENVVKFPTENFSMPLSGLIALGVFVQFYFQPIILLISLPIIFDTKVNTIDI